MGRPRAYERMLNSMRAFFGLIGRSSEGAHVIELDGVLACVCPTVPGRSMPNSVIYESPAQLSDALPELARHYDDAGVDAWTVWVPEGDAEAPNALAAAGHDLDADPAAMTLDLATLVEPGGDLDYRVGDLMPSVARVNDSAYPFDGAPFATMTSDWPEGVTRDYVADVDGEPAVALSILRVEGDASVVLVATRPEARGRGLASRLLHRALWDARADGCDLSTLQATKAGEPIYSRLGYERHGALQMWERRR